MTNQNNDFISTIDCEINNDSSDIISIDDEIDRISRLTHELKKDDDVVSMTDDDIKEMLGLTGDYEWKKDNGIVNLTDDDINEMLDLRGDEMISTSSEVLYIFFEFEFFFVSS